MANSAAAISVESWVVVPWNETVSAVEPQQAEIWALVPETQTKACHVKVICEKSQEFGIFYSRAKGTVWTAEQKCKNRLVLLRLHRNLFGRYDRAPRDALPVVKQSGSKRKSKKDEPLEPQATTSKQKRLRQSSNDASSESDSASADSVAASKDLEAIDHEDPEQVDSDSDMSSGASVVNQPAVDSKCEKPPVALTFTAALAKTRTWRTNPQAEARASLQERIAVYEVLLREYRMVLPMTEAAKACWEDLEASMNSDGEDEAIEDIFGSIPVRELAEVLMPWKLSYERQIEIWDELVRAKLLVIPEWAQVLLLNRDEDHRELIHGLEAAFDGEKWSCQLCSVFGHRNCKTWDCTCSDCQCRHNPLRSNSVDDGLQTPQERQRRSKLKKVLVEFGRSQSRHVLRAWKWVSDAHSYESYYNKHGCSDVEAIYWTYFKRPPTKAEVEHQRIGASHLKDFVPIPELVKVDRFDRYFYQSYRLFSEGKPPVTPEYLQDWDCSSDLDWIRFLVDDHRSSVEEGECRAILEQCKTEAQAERVLARAFVLEKKWKKQVKEIQSAK